MKKIILMLLVFCAFSGKAIADDGDHTDTPPGSAPADSFYDAVEGYFKVSADQIQSCKSSNLGDDEIPVVFFIAQRAGVDPQAVLVVRSSGFNWMQTAYHFKLNPKIFFVALSANAAARPPYQKSYGYYKGHSNRVNLSDPDIINWVNLKFLSEHYGYDPQEIIQMRSTGKSFGDINTYYADKKEQAGWDVDEPSVESLTPVVKEKVDKALEQFGNMNHGMGSNPMPAD